MGADHQLFHGIIHFPVIVPDLLTAGFLGPVGAGFQIDTYGAVLAGNKGTEFLGAGFIRIDSNMPAGNLVTRVGGLGKVTQALLLVQPPVNGGFSVLHGNGVVAQLPRPIGVLGGRFHNEILSGNQVGNVDAPRCVCGKGRAWDFCAVLFDDELPTVQVIAGVGGLSDFQCAVLCVGKAHRSRLTGYYGHGFHAGIADPIGITGNQLLGVQSSGLQAGYGHGAITAGCKGRTGDGIGAGRICVQADFPPAQVLTGVCGFRDLHGAGGQLVIEADAGGNAVGDADHLWILSGTGVAGGNGTVGMPQLLDVISSSVQPGDTDFSVAVRCMGAGYQGGAGGIGIHTETPTR